MNQGKEQDTIERMREHLITCQRLVLLGRLAPWITHEVNNHLTGVSGYAQLLLGQERAAVVAEELGKINSSANKCQKLIADLRRFSRFGNAKREYNNISLIIKSSLDIIRSQFAKRSLSLVENYSPDILPIEVDTTALEQVFLNIMQNALESIEKDGGSLTVSTLTEGENIVATFEDTGPGLSEDARAQLFTPFFTTKEHLHCPGLGLSAAKILVESHGGTIDINNMAGGGACVKVSIPSEPITG